MKNLRYILLLIPFVLCSQINESDTLDFKGDLSITGFYQGGNVETKIFRAKSEISVIPFRKWVFKTTNSYVFQEFGKEKADEDILSLNFLYLNPRKKVYPLLLAFTSTNFRRKIDLRYLLGAGVTFQIFSKNDNWLKMTVSSEFEQTDFFETNYNHDSYDGQRIINTMRGTVWIKGKYDLFDKKLILKHESYFQPSLEESDNFRWSADIALELPLWKFLNFKINYLHTFESLVIENQKREDNMLTFGFTLKSY